MPADTSTTDRNTNLHEPGAADGYLAYLDTLRDLGNQAASVNTALLQAHTAGTCDARRKALTELHMRLRQTAATANQVLGDWPDPDTSRP